MMAGPNRDKNPAFFTDWPVLEAEINTYLTERETGDPAGDDGLPGEQNALLRYLSIDPTAMALEDKPDPDEWDGEVDVLAYTELTR